MLAGPSRRRGNRPSALDFSEPLGSEDDSATTSDASLKRNRGNGGDADLRNAKRRNLDAVPLPARKYEPRPYEMLETSDLLVFGEEDDPPDDGRKRIRTLSHFSFFDARYDNAMVSLDVLDEGRGDGHSVIGAGFIVAQCELDEDAGQEDDLDEEAERQYVRMTRILKYFTKYWEKDSPFYVETDHAFYELKVFEPSKRYRHQFRPFWRLQTTLRFIISSAHDDPEQEFSAFLRKYFQLEVFGQALTERELWDAVPKLRETLENIPNADPLRASIVIHHLLFHLNPVIFRPVATKTGLDKQLAEDDLPILYEGNLDLAVLRQTVPTHVTPRIEQLARGLIKEKLRVLGPKPRDEPALPKKPTDRLRGFLKGVYTRKLIQFRPGQRIGRSSWLKHVLIDDLKYEVGDTVLLYSGKDLPPDLNDIPPTDTLADYFWFARIIHMNEWGDSVHVHWFQHSSRTLLQELGHPQELFLTDQCDRQSFKHIMGKVDAHYIKPHQSLANIQPRDFFYRYQWDHLEGTFTDIDMDALNFAAREPPPDNCPACKISNAFDEGTEAANIHLGIRWHGKEYHLDDCVMIKADEGPCHIGQILRFIRRGGHGNVDVVVRLFGRTDRIGSRPDTTLKDERHLFLTDDEMTTGVYNLIGVCYVVVKGSLPELDAWLAMSPHRFYVKYRFPSLSVVSWNSRHRVHWGDLPICPICLRQDIRKFDGMRTFLERERPLRVFDPFAGTGAFCLGMEEVGCFKLTHAVEISPSAAKTLRNNTSADVKVYNQCSNRILRHAVLEHENKDPELLKSIEGRDLPPLPKPGDIDCLVTGFPCQPHSTLNMYQKAEDGKSNLILTTLSFVDFLKPQYCVFENVRGFLYHALCARQHDKYSIKGGIPLGGLKLVAAALLDMGYQLRTALLQAGHYGTPQSRVRFFLIAAKRGLELPTFPQPTHDFPVSDRLEIKFPEEVVLQPITTLSGVAPHRYVSVHDAISDLPKFDWKHPRQQLNRREMEKNRLKECRDDRAWCGFNGPDVPYEHEPHTRFQQSCRRRPTRDIQQYTRTYDPKKVERVVEIPVEADADYRRLRPDLWEWQLVNPQSSVARASFRAGYYGRVQRDGWFQTTVTNVDPTAKQCRVIHPYSKRIVTVRELARSQGFPDHFVFYAQDNRVVTMHRQIGNAVPWPVSIAIAREFRETLCKNWVKRNPFPDESTDEEFLNEEGGSNGSTDNDAMEID